MLEGLFGVVSRLFSVSVIERQPWELDAQTWDEGVRFFEVTLIARYSHEAVSHRCHIAD